LEEKRDEWSSFADLLGNLIAKYYDVLDIDSLPDPQQEEFKSKEFEDRKR